MEFLPLIGIALLFWVLLIRPQAKRQRELREMQDSLGVGNDVVLTSGIYGTIRAVVDEDTFGVEVADGVIIRVAKGAIGAHKPALEPADEADEPLVGEEGNE